MLLYVDRYFSPEYKIFVATQHQQEEIDRETERETHGDIKRNEPTHDFSFNNAKKTTQKRTASGKLILACVRIVIFLEGQMKPLNLVITAAYNTYIISLYLS